MWACSGKENTRQVQPAQIARTRGMDVAYQTLRFRKLASLREKKSIDQPANDSTSSFC